uniref:phosphoglycolate phosphatase n=1 Tax=uncultured Elusimicrobia bacterium TaxID=699876 RepID=A0A650ENE6_9BACT|nr:phosphoglycolate phosphatase [uncultured Elusimicrobia bacterium]
MKIAIFDLDGTLLNTIADLAHAANQALKTLGFPQRTEEECVSFVGNGVTKLLERSLPDDAKTPGNVARMREEFFKYYDAHLWDATFAYPGMAELLEALQMRGVMLAVASNKYQSATERLVKYFFPHVQFLEVLGQRDGVPTKPDPDIVYEILLSAGARKEDVLYIGDSDVDMQTAKNAGVRVCAVTWGFRSRELLETFQPDFITGTPQDILAMI